MTAATLAPTAAGPGIARTGAVAGICATVAVIVVNFGLGDATAPAVDADHDAIVDWIAAAPAQRAAATALRLVALALVPLVASGLSAHVRQGPDRGQRGWSVVGALGLTWLVGVGTISTTLEAVAVSRGDALAAQPQLTAGLWFSVNGLFTVALLAWGVGLAGFSEAARRSATLPRWVIGLGYAIGVGGVLSAATLTPFLEGHAWAHAPSIVAFFGVLVWVPAAAAHILRSGRPS